LELIRLDPADVLTVAPGERGQVRITLSDRHPVPPRSVYEITVVNADDESEHDYFVVVVDPA
jgi:hypothetical protein